MLHRIPSWFPQFSILEYSRCVVTLPGTADIAALVTVTSMMGLKDFTHDMEGVSRYLCIWPLEMLIGPPDYILTTGTLLVNWFPCVLGEMFIITLMNDAYQLQQLSGSESACRAGVSLSDSQALINQLMYQSTSAAIRHDNWRRHVREQPEFVTRRQLVNQLLLVTGTLSRH